MKHKVKVIDAGAIPLTTWSNRDKWKLRKGEPGPGWGPPRVLLEVSEEVARAFGGRMGEEIEVEMIEGGEARS